MNSGLWPGESHKSGGGWLGERHGSSRPRHPESENVSQVVDRVGDERHRVRRDAVHDFHDDEPQVEQDARRERRAEALGCGRVFMAASVSVTTSVSVFVLVFLIHEDSPSFVALTTPFAVEASPTPSRWRAVRTLSAL